MVKMTIKRAEDTAEDDMWVCKRIDDDPESEQADKGANGALAVDEENLRNESEDSGNWCHKIPSYLQIEMKEIDNQQPFGEISTENNKNTLQNQLPTYSQAIAGNSCIGPMGLSASDPKHQSQIDVAKNASFVSTIEACVSKRRFRENPYYNILNAKSLTGLEAIEGQAAPDFIRGMQSQITSLSTNHRQMNSGEVVAMETGTMPSSSKRVSMKILGNSPISGGFVNSEKPEKIARGNISNPLQQETPRSLMTNYTQFSADARHALSANAPDSSNQSYYRQLGPESNAGILATRNEFTERLGDNFVNCSTEARNYSHSSNEPNSAAEGYNWPLGPESNASNLAIGNEVRERIENFVNNLPQNSTHYLKRLSKSCAQKGNNDALESVRPPKRKKSHTEAPGTIYSCHVCKCSYKSSCGYATHLRTVKHLRMVNETFRQQANFYNFPQSLASTSIRTTMLQTQPQPPPYLINNQIMYLNMLQAHAMAAAKQPVSDRAIMNNTYCNEKPLGHNRLHNDLDTKCYVQNPIHMNLPVNTPTSPQGHLLPRNPQLENSGMANPKYLENKEFQSSRTHKDPSSQIQPENSSVSCSKAASGPLTNKPNPLENVTISGSVQKSVEVQPVPRQQSEFLRVYQCRICLTFHTDSLQELELHISIDRSRTPFEIITISGNSLLCELCNYKTPASVEMIRHCTNKMHLYRVEYYNHVMEGGVNAKHKLDNLHMFTQVSLLCCACEFPTTSMDTLKFHSAHLRHKRNVSFCMYALKISPAIEYCYCGTCNVRISTKRELLLHVRSNSHINTLWQYPTGESALNDPAQLIFIKESSLNRNEPPRVSEKIQGRKCIEREKPHLRKETNVNNAITENPEPLDLSSAASTSKPLPVSCTLCQQVLPEVDDLALHLQQIHGVNESGVRWLVSETTKVHEEKLSTEEIANSMASEPKSIATQKNSSATNKTLPIQGMSIDSSSCHRSVADVQNVKSKSSECFQTFTSEQNEAIGWNLNQEEMTDINSPSSHQLCKTKLAGRSNTDASASQQFYELAEQNVECKSSACRKAVTSEQKVVIGENLNEKGKIYTDSFSSQQFYKPESMHNLEEADQNPEGRTAKGFSSSQQLCETERMQKPEKLFRNPEGGTGANSTTSQQFCEKEGMQNLRGTNQNPDFDKERVNVNPSSCQQFHKTENIPPVEKNLSSSSLEVIVEYVSEPNEDGRYETKKDDSPSELISATGHKTVSKSDLDAKRKKNLSSASDHRSSKQHFYEKVNISPLGEGPSSEENLNGSITLESGVTEEYESEPEQFSTTQHGSPFLLSDHNASREKNDSSSSDQNSGTPERLLAIYDSSMAYKTLTSQSNFNESREMNDSLSSDHSSVSNKRSSSTENSSSDEHRSPIAHSGLNMRKERNVLSSSGNNSVTHQHLSSPTDNSTSELFLPTEHGTPKSHFKASRKRNDLCDDICVEYEWSPARAQNSRVNSPPSQHYRMDSKHRGSSLEDQRNFNLQKKLVMDSPISRPVALVEFKQGADNMSVMRKHVNDSVNSQMLYDCPNEYEAVFSEPNSPGKIDPQIPARSNIVISEVFSLIDNAESRSNTDDDEDESLDFQNIEFSDLEDV